MFTSSIHVQQSHIPSMQNAVLPPQPVHTQQQNGHNHHAAQQPLSQRPSAKEPIRVTAIPSIIVQGDQVLYGEADSRK